jgi:translation initiation factor IF-2
MAENKNSDKKLSVSGKTLTLKRSAETGVVRQSFSHGRTKSVVVEKVKRRVIGGAAEPKAEAPAAAPAAEAKAAPRPGAKAAPQPAGAPKPSSGVVLRTLSEEERSARANALTDFRVREAEERKIAEEEARRRASREGVDRSEREAAEARKREEDDRRRHDEETKRKADEVAKKRLGGEEEAKRPHSRTLKPEADEDEAPRTARRGPGGAARPAVAPKPAPKGPVKQRGRLTLVTALTADDVRERSIASFRRRTQRLKGHASDEPKEKLIREVIIPEAITIQELANRMAERAVDVIRLLMNRARW